MFKALCGLAAGGLLLAVATTAPADARERSGKAGVQTQGQMDDVSAGRRGGWRGGGRGFRGHGGFRGHRGFYGPRYGYRGGYRSFGPRYGYYGGGYRPYYGGYYPAYGYRPHYSYGPSISFGFPGIGIGFGGRGWY